jgi:site-specific DNA recombinase
MIAAAKRQEFDILLLDDLSRLTRDSMEQEKTIRTLEFAGGCNVRIVSTADGYDSLHASRKMQRGMKGMMNELFLDDLAQKVHRGQRGQAQRKFWNGGKPYGFRLKAVTDNTRLDPYGNPARVGTVLDIDKTQAPIVVEIFTRYGNGESAQSIASDLNTRKIASAGSTWKRVTRRADKWLSSSVRVILVNPLYTGQQRWNCSQFVKNPDTGKHVRRARPESEHVINQIESLRIVSDVLWQRVQARTKSARSDDRRLKIGGKTRFLLSGLLHCAVCGANYVIADAYSYACSSFANGGPAACSNNMRVNRKSLENTILGPVIADLQDPARLKAMAQRMERQFAKRMQTQATRATTLPAELQKLDERLAKLRSMTELDEDERQLLIDKTESKRKELLAKQPAAVQQAKILTILPKAAASYSRLVEDGLAGDERSAAKVRVILKDMLGPISLSPGDCGSLWAAYYDNPWALVRDAAGFCGRGDRI